MPVLHRMVVCHGESFVYNEWFVILCNIIHNSLWLFASILLTEIYTISLISLKEFGMLDPAWCPLQSSCLVHQLYVVWYLQSCGTSMHEMMLHSSLRSRLSGNVIINSSKWWCCSEMCPSAGRWYASVSYDLSWTVVIVVYVNCLSRHNCANVKIVKL